MSGVLVDRDLLLTVVSFLTFRHYCSFCGVPTKDVDLPDQQHKEGCPAIGIRSALALPAQAAAPELVKEAREIAARLPTDARADWRYTNHFELNGSGEYPWLTLADTQALDDTEYGQRVGAVLDAAAMLPRLVTALLPAQAAADAAGVLRQVALMAEAIQIADRLPEGSEDRRWAFTDYVNVESRLRREDPAHLRALADALEVQERRDGVNVAELHALALEASDTKSTGRKVRHARDELLRICLALGGDS